jgi:copper transport protein
MNIRLNPLMRLLSRASRAFAIIATVATAATPRVAWAHAHLVKSAPAAGSHVRISPTAIQLWYSEAADPTLTTVSIIGPDGAHILTGKLLAAAANPLLLSTTLASPLPPGRYTVNWHAVAKDDGHPSQGSFVFTVDSATAGVTGAVANNDSMSRSDTVPTMNAPVKAETASIQWMDVEAPGYIIARWLSFAGLISVLGVVGFALLVLPRVAPQNDAAQMSNFKVSARRRAMTLGVVAALVIIVSAVWRLYAELGVVGGDVTVGKLIQTFWGHVWLAQVVLAALLCLTFSHARGERAGKSVSPAWPVTVIAALLLSATPTFSGHAAAAVSHRALSIGLDIVHVLAAGGWLGGLFILAAAGVPAALATRADTETSEPLPLIARLVNAFSPLALCLASLVVLTGAVAAWLHVGSFSGLFHSAYGAVLLVKLACVVLVLAAGGHNWLRMRAELAHPETGASAVGSFRRSAWSELTFAAMVIAATAVLVAVQPPLH